MNTPGQATLVRTSASAPENFGTHAFRLEGVEPIEARFDLLLNGVVASVPTTMHDTRTVNVYIEAPGHYRLRAWWWDGTRSGEAETRFTIAPRMAAAVPQNRDTADGFDLWFPTGCDASLGSSHEIDVIRMLPKLVAAGSVVYDIGANVGLFAVRFARLAGASGAVYCFEPNPVCVQFLQANLTRYAVGDYRIIPSPVLDAQYTIPLTINVGNSHLAAIPNPAADFKTGHRILVEGDALDSFVRRYGLREPTLIKIDVEGAEGAVVAGMTTVLKEARPALLMELHGAKAASETLTALDGVDYSYVELSKGQRFESARQLRNWYPDACLQVLGHPRNQFLI